MSCGFRTGPILEHVNQRPATIRPDELHKRQIHLGELDWSVSGAGEFALDEDGQIGRGAEDDRIRCRYPLPVLILILYPDRGQ